MSELDPAGDCQRPEHRSDSSRCATAYLPETECSDPYPERWFRRVRGLASCCLKAIAPPAPAPSIPEQVPKAEAIVDAADTDQTTQESCGQPADLQLVLKLLEPSSRIMTRGAEAQMP